MIRYAFFILLLLTASLCYSQTEYAVKKDTVCSVKEVRLQKVIMLASTKESPVMTVYNGYAGPESYPRRVEGEMITPYYQDFYDEKLNKLPKTTIVWKFIKSE